MELALKCKTCPCVLHASPISPLALTTSAIGSNDSNRVSTPKFFCYLAARSPLFRVSVVRAQADPPKRSTASVHLSAVACVSYWQVPSVSAGCLYRWWHEDVQYIGDRTAAGRPCPIVMMWLCCGGVPSAVRATNIALLLSVCCYMLRQHLAVGHHCIYFVVKYYLQLVQRHFKAWRFLYVPQSVRLKNSTWCWALLWVFCTDLRTDSGLWCIRHWLIGFYSGGGKCLQRGTDWLLI